MGAINLGIDVGRWHLRLLLTNESDDEPEDDIEGTASLAAAVQIADDEVPCFGFAPIPAPWDDEE